MKVSFERTGERRYATVVTLPGQAPRRMDPAPAYDDEIPHDLVHYLVEAELGLASGVYGRAAAGGGEFLAASDAPGDPRRQARERRRLKKREASLSRTDPGDMARSEHLAGLCDLAWRRRAGARTPAWAERRPIPAEDAPIVDRVLDRLDETAPLWRDLPIGGALTFTWPDTSVTVSR
ncbi:MULTISPECIES: hypothetical protein [Actinomadura]|uniref:Uncharacterized protein n=1 Tax=Actinomadura livida TaxID=79909 RepID=A0A7W7IEY8_9ACTN|nr:MULTISPECIES: hypothetical protein [Actinomadura]MBB4775755.1 hypothetical protein [Actinomadura catellatispora]TDB98383.1 hypothetical protein E1266_03170 [Actinomadura sp. 7K534]GGU34894.1 hypothetical protein GCM10010208_69440 [Actinomadura livida]